MSPMYKYLHIGYLLQSSKIINILILQNVISLTHNQFRLLGDFTHCVYMKSQTSYTKREAFKVILKKAAWQIEAWFFTYHSCSHLEASPMSKPNIK